MPLVQFKRPLDHYAVGDVVELSKDEKKRVDEYAKIHKVDEPYKSVSKKEAEDLGGSGSVEAEAREQVDHNGKRVLSDEAYKDDPEPQTPLRGDGTVSVQNSEVATGQVSPDESEGAHREVTKEQKKAAKEAAKKEKEAQKNAQSNDNK